MLYTCIKIFFARIIDVSLGTVRTVLVVKGEKVTPAVVAFFEVFIWFLVAREALNTSTDSWLIPIFYSLGYATGTYIGTFISNTFVDSLIGVQVITKEKFSLEMVTQIRSSGFGVSAVDLKHTKDDEDKDMLLIELNKSKLKTLTRIIRSIDKDAFVIINETKYVQNGLIK